MRDSSNRWQEPSDNHAVIDCTTDPVSSSRQQLSEPRALEGLWYVVLHPMLTACYVLLHVPQSCSSFYKNSKNH